MNSQEQIPNFLSHGQRTETLFSLAKIMGLKFLGETNGAYLPRAVSSVPNDEKERLELIYQQMISATKKAGLEARLPVELEEGLNPNKVNPGNYELLFSSKLILPLTFATSDGRGSEIGFSYLKKLLVPVILPEQLVNGNKPNIPTLRLPYEIPVIFNGEDNLSRVIKMLMDYQIGFGTFEGERTVIGTKKGISVDLRKEVSNIAEVLPYLL